MIDNTIFTFGSNVPKTKWVLNKMLALGHLVLFIAQAGAGKSFWLEALAVSIVHGDRFMDKATIEGDVLLIDQDTPTDVLRARLNRMALSIGGKPEYNLHVLSMEGLSLKDGTLAKAINKYPSVVLVIIDSLHSVCAGLDTNTTKDMSRLATLKSQCGLSSRTICFIHHISEKNTDPLDDLMFGEVRKLAMGNSVANQQADAYYVMAGRTTKGELDRIYIRPVSKRALIPQVPFYANFVNGTENSIGFEYGGACEKAKDANEEYVLNLFEKAEDWRSVDDCQKELKGLVGVRKVREVLMCLHHTGKLDFHKEGTNKYMFCLPEEKEEVDNDE